FVDEAHVADEWGNDKLRPVYRELGELRTWCGYGVPIWACTVTARTSTFNLIWKTLRFGSQPFWGIDIGADHPNPYFHTRIFKSIDNPVLDALNLLPSDIDDSTMHEEIPKCLFYFDSENACRVAVDTLCKCLLNHLRDCVFHFSSDISERGKQRCWNDFSSGTIRIICATDAAGIGCSVPDVQYSVIFGLPSSLAVVIQRWGHA
ncbi:hypothetical protein GYMLUDRAFT_113426, partial [Collybiopsis luxurians FD-317 M1]